MTLKKFSAAATIHLVSDADHTGRQAFYFIKVPAPKQKIFLAAMQNRKDLDLAEYGEILYSAYGDTPPEHIKRMMRKQHGWSGD